MTQWLQPTAALLIVALSLTIIRTNGQPMASISTDSTYRQVAEYEPTAAVWLLFPQVTHKKDLPIEPVVASIIKAVSSCARVNLVVFNDSLRQQATRLLPDTLLATGRVMLHQFPYHEFWARDMGPRFVKNAAGKKAMVDFKFNTWSYADTTDVNARLDEKLDERIAAQLNLPIFSSEVITEGGDHEINRQGIMMAVRSVEKGRNPNWSFLQLENEFRRVLGVKKIIWLNQGLRDDDHTFLGPIAGPKGQKYYTALTTNGHVDEVARFVNDSTILLAWIDPADRHSAIEQETGRRMEVNLRILQAATDAKGHHFRILKLRLPSPIITTLRPGDGVYDAISKLIYTNGSVFPIGKPVAVVAAASYLNFLIVNDCVLVPAYWQMGRDPTLQKNDAEAMGVFRQVFPEKRIIQIDILPVNIGGGGIHCITANEPR